MPVWNSFKAWKSVPSPRSSSGLAPSGASRANRRSACSLTLATSGVTATGRDGAWRCSHIRPSGPVQRAQTPSMEPSPRRIGDSRTSAWATPFRTVAVCRSGCASSRSLRPMASSTARGPRPSNAAVSRAISGRPTPITRGASASRVSPRGDAASIRSASISPTASTIHATAAVHIPGAATATASAGRAPAAIRPIARRVG